MQKISLSNSSRSAPNGFDAPGGAIIDPARHKAGEGPKISVLMPVHNGDVYLGEAVDSILHQTEPRFEFLIVDDGSTDRSRDLLRAYANTDPRIRLLLRDHEGLVPALNYGISVACAPFLARMDADDVALPDRFARQLAALEADPRIGALGTHVEVIDQVGRPIRSFTPPADHDTLDAHLITHGSPCFWHPSVMMRTDLLREIGGYSEAYPYTEDLDLWFRIAEQMRLSVLPETLLKYRVHLASVSVTKRATQHRSARAAWLAACRRRGSTAPDLPAIPAAAPTEVDIMRKWAAWAMRSGHFSTARHYAWKSFRTAPFTPGAAGLLFWVMTGRGIRRRS
jgi:GT2 family glycosyltransferase